MSLESDPRLPPLQFKGEIMDFDLGLDVDHRKRRRNRTTQSCLNCHTSKRKCDRKRPCSRCIQLGLTGLCVYEVDDPALRDDPNIDEVTRLRNRIAELESLVRELRGKPHPRWAEPNYCDGDSHEKWHSRSSKRTQSQYQKNRRDDLDTATGVASHIASAVKSETSELARQQLYSLSSTANSSIANDPSIVSHTYYRAYQQTGQEMGSPTDDSTYYSSSSSSSPMGFSAHRHPDGATYIDGNDYSHHSYRNGALHLSCTCLTNPAATHPIIALTNQVRHSSQQLRQLPEHQSQHECLVLSRIMELDDILQTISRSGNDSAYTTNSPYEALPPSAENELVPPTPSSGHPTLGNAMHDWSSTVTATQSSYDAYYPISAGEHGVYHKAYHIG